MDETIIDRAVSAALAVGADRTPVTLADLHRAYQARHPALEASRPLENFRTLVTLHCINDPGRFPDPADPLAAAPWLRRPLFQAVPRTRFLLLNERERTRFFVLLRAKDERIFQPDYLVKDVLGTRP